MSDEQTPASSPDEAPPVTSENVEVPAAAPGQWVMQQPVFRQSSGYLPQGYEKLYGQSDGSAATAVAAAVATEAPPAEVMPQPDVAEEVTYAEPEPPAPVKTRSTAMRITLLVLGLLAMAAIIVAFLAVIYFLFFSSPGESQVFN